MHFNGQTGGIDVTAKRELDLDVVRGMAIVLAMGWHFNNRPTGYALMDGLLWPGRAFGWAGVDLFFVLSGFLVGRLVMKEQLQTGQFNAKRFLIRRAFKLWPILYIFLVFMVFAVPWQQFLIQIGTHTQNFFRTSVATHLWSLAVEEHFYLVFSLLFAFYCKRSFGVGVLYKVLITLLIAAPVLRLVAVLNEMDPISVQYQTQFRMDGLAFGVLLAALFVHHKNTFEMLVQKKCLWMLCTLGGYYLLSHVQKISPIGMVAGYSLSYLAGASLLLLVYKSKIEGVAPLLVKSFAFMGVYSYAMYIWHVPAAKISEIILGKMGVAHYEWFVILCLYLSSIVVAYVATKLIEKPFMKLRDKLYPSE
jgi:peptidoglycan/LPS O-acetylase OafA/YrhL